MRARRMVMVVGVLTFAVACTGCAQYQNRYYGDGWGGPMGLSMRFEPGEHPGSDCGHCGGHGSGCCWPDWRDGMYRMLTCSSGCGDIYWGEWTYDPPDGCDPCDDCGNWLGPQDCPTRHDKLKSGLMGHRFCDATCGGCGTCGQASTIVSQSFDVTEPPLTPTPAKTTPPAGADVYYDR